MIIYNVTVIVDVDVHDEWLNWMKTDHIPDVMSTGFFMKSKMSKILAFEEGGLSYSIQYSCKDMPTLERYQSEAGPRLQEEHSAKFAGKFEAFRTLLQVVAEHQT